MISHKNKSLPLIGLVGAGKLLCDFARMLISNDFPKPFFFTHKKSLHKRDQNLLSGTKNYENIFEFCSREKIKIFELEDINDSKSLSIFKSSNIDYLISLSARWIIGEKLISHFGSNLLNLHHGDLPGERGSTTATHRIMNGKNLVGVSMHIIERGIDSGPLLYKENEMINNERPTHDDMNNMHAKLSLNIINRFINDLLSGHLPKPIIQDQSEAFYLPQLFTELNGAINWGWSSDQIDKFVRAFGFPFPGAYTFYGDKKINILSGYSEGTNDNIHPFYYGRIVTKDKNGGTKIVTSSGLFVITKVTFENKDYLLNKLKVSRILHTPSDMLELARTETKRSLEMEIPKK